MALFTAKGANVYRPRPPVQGGNAEDEAAKRQENADSANDVCHPLRQYYEREDPVRKIVLALQQLGTQLATYVAKHYNMEVLYDEMGLSDPELWAFYDCSKEELAAMQAEWENDVDRWQQKRVRAEHRISRLLSRLHFNVPNKPPKSWKDLPVRLFWRRVGGNFTDMLAQELIDLAYATLMVPLCQDCRDFFVESYGDQLKDSCDESEDEG